MKCRKYYKSEEKYKEYAKRWKRKHGQRHGAFKYRASYSEREDKLILRHEIPDAELSLKIHHSVNAIQKRRWMLKKEESVEE